MSESRQGGRSKQAPARATRARKTKAKTNSAPSKASRPTPRTSAGNFEKVRALCLALPDTKLTMTWGSPHFRVGDKIFCGYGEDADGKQVLSVKLKLDHAQQVLQNPGFSPAKYVGKHGWVTLDVKLRKSWAQVAELVRESYELIAPQASRAKLR